MTTGRLAGSRIREIRLDRGLRQASVAEAAGISASYLNLIEHNRRRIGGKLLSDIARAMDVEPSRLNEGASAETLDQLHNAASLLGDEVEVARAEELAARFPGWAALIVAQARRNDALSQQVQALTDRMAHDPRLATSLHEVISAVSSIRSSSSILVGAEKLDEDWQRRFHENIHKDSLRLAASSEALISYLEAPDTDGDQSRTPIAQVEDYLAQRDYHLAALEGNTADIDDVVAESGLQGAARSLFAQIARNYRADAVALALGPFVSAARACAYDPALLADQCAAPFVTVLRRLACLPPDGSHPPLGLVSCDAAGVVTFLKPVPGFSMPRGPGACPLWPLYGALGRPAQPLRVEVALPGPNAPRFLCYALAEARVSTRFDVPPVIRSTMLVMPDPPESDSAALPAGVSCRICPRDNCESRREPAMSGL
ncbi:MAG: short-chain fatty acyl-CoA regulator family protein [Yoonia sp.]|uniref:short-chain fatty acyl-CoA regulator family protein n=1 Tax=Yoonia sp. TaxID=2212373 RepID=UPI003EFA31A8